MIYPSVGQYTEAIKLAEQSPEDYFATKTTLRPILGADGNPVMSSGNFAVVFKMQDQNDGKIYALKCFTRDQEGRNESYRLIADELQYVESEYLTKIQYLENELFVDTGTVENEFPVLLMDWVEGETLDKYIKNHISEPLCLEMLACDFAYLADWLLKQPFAHGDLKPDNIIVKDDGTLVIVDYDGMYVPKMRGQKARELGSPDFRHPQRTEDDFDEHIDDFAIVTLLLTIKAIALNPNILEDCNAKDCVLLHTQDFTNLAQSAVNQKLQELIGDSNFARVYAVFVVVLAEKVVDMVMFASVVDKVDLNELEYQYARYLCNDGEGSETNLNYAYKIFEKLSNNNYVDGELCFSCCLKQGYGCHIDEGKSISILTYHANKGNSRAQRNLGYYYESKKEFKNAVEWYTKAADQGYATAQCNLGFCYENGQGIEQDYQKAVEWYTKAAEQGNAVAQNNLGICYAEGRGIEKDYNKAVEWFTKAAEQGYAQAQYNLGICYTGEGVEQDYQKAVEWFTKAAEQGYADAQFNLGIGYYTGEGVEQDYQKAVEWYTKAAEQGNARAQNNLGVCYERGQGVDQDYKKAVEWYTKAAEQGYATAQCNLGFCYENGQGIEQDYQKAVEWYTKAAEQGNARAQNNLGVCYEKGQGVKKDYNKAKEWFSKAAEQGNEKAKTNLKRVNDLLSNDLPF
jgi:TPR repeat protein